MTKKLSLNVASVGKH